MADETHSVRFGVYLDKDLVDRCDAVLPKANAGSRSELIADALTFYLAWLDTGDYSKVLTPALESVIDARIKATEKNIGKILFNISVELGLLQHVIAASQHYSPNTISNLRNVCIDEIKETHGVLPFENAVKYQKS
jgi:Predicted transcriptional regulators containing the CopG/Arc/MetJ DNA-binding domain and a metal-binding domain